MPLRNRVDPFGEIHAVAARGLLTGNRGVIHDPATRTLMKRGWTTKAWIVCALVHPRGKRRVPMGRNGSTGGAGWTELFFLDEVTALAAGHRPCFHCRRAAALRFADAFAAGNRLARAQAPDIDAILHGQRTATGAAPAALGIEELARLPDGAMVARNGRPHAVRAGRLVPWSFAGYGRPVSLRGRDEALALVTPSGTVAALRAGYRPLWHPMARPSKEG